MIADRKLDAHAHPNTGVKMRFVILALFTLTACASRMKTSMPAAPPSPKTEESSFTPVARAEKWAGANQDWAVEPVGAKTFPVKFELESRLNLGETRIAAGCVNTLETGMTVRSLILVSNDGGKTWREADLAIPNSCVSDVNVDKSGVFSGLVFWSSGDGSYQGLAVSRNKGQTWEFIEAPKSFDAQKWLGPGSYGDLGHMTDSKGATIYLRGAKASQKFHVDFKSKMIRPTGTIPKSEIKKRETEIATKEIPEAERSAFSPRDFMFDRETGQLHMK